MKDVQAVYSVRDVCGDRRGRAFSLGQMECLSFLSLAGSALGLRLGREAEESGASLGHTKVAVSPRSAWTSPIEVLFVWNSKPINVLGLREQSTRDCGT